jgi:hypothetical protein
VIARTQFRRRSGSREPLLGPLSSDSIAGSFHTQPDTWGKLTSRRATPEQREQLELLAYQLKCTVSTVKALIDRGLL